LRIKTPDAFSKKLLRRITKESAKPSELRDRAFRQRILSIPKGKVATYGQVAAAAGYPLYHRAVARLLRTTPSHALPWQRVIGAGGEIKLRFEAASEQRLLLEMEGVAFRGRRVDLAAHQHIFGAWETNEFERRRLIRPSEMICSSRSSLGAEWFWSAQLGKARRRKFTIPPVECRHQEIHLVEGG